MKLKRIFLVRHGESEGNVDKKIYNVKPDYAVKLTDLGIQQAFEAGVELKKVINNESVGFISSGYMRTRQTLDEILKSFPTPIFKKEDPRLREHEWTAQLLDLNKETWEDKAVEFGVFYFRFFTGESCADAYDRICTWKIDLEREIEEMPENLVIVGHGMTNRIILMRFLNLTVEEFELLANPKNGEFFVLDISPTKQYNLNREVRKHQKLKRLF